MKQVNERMKKILNYFSVDGAVGGNQEWFKNVVMYIAAVRRRQPVTAVSIWLCAGAWNICIRTTSMR